MARDGVILCTPICRWNLYFGPARCSEAFAQRENFFACATWWNVRVCRRVRHIAFLELYRKEG